MFETVCSDGYYGDACTHTCSEQCISNKTCHHISGACESGTCKEGYTGERCDQGNTWKHYITLHYI